MAMQELVRSVRLDPGQSACVASVSAYLRWEVAGSVRRAQKTVGDIEHVIWPARASTEVLFGETGPAVNLVRAVLDQLIWHGRIAWHVYSDGRMRRGDRYLGVDLDGRRHELFMCDADNWGLILAIRTGPADWSRWMVTHLKRMGYACRDGRLYKARRFGGEDPEALAVDEQSPPVPVPDEQTLFQLMRMEFIPPEARR